MEGTKENSDCIKGVFAVFVILHHVYQESGVLHFGPVGIVLQALGYLSVATFFFISGYGLAASYIAKGDFYLKDFPKMHLSTKTGHANLKIGHGKKKLWPGHAKTCASDPPPLDRT